jgi:transposase
MDKFFFIGIDVSKDHLVAAVNGAKPRSFTNTTHGAKALYSWALKHRGDLAPWFVMESSGVYSKVAAGNLCALPQATVSIIEPGRIKAHAYAIGRRSKTDPQDALVILDYAQKNKLHPWRLAQRAFARLRELVDHFNDLQSMLKQVKNRKHAQDFAKVKGIVARSNAALAKTLKREIGKIEQAIKELVEGDEQLHHQVKLLKTIPGFALNSASQLLAYTRGEITSRTPKQLTAFAGLAPAQKQSGTSLDGQSHIDKRGCAPLRSILWMCSLSAAESNPAVKPLYQRLTTRDKRPLVPRQARVAVMRKLLLLARAILVADRPFIPDHSAQSA